MGGILGEIKISKEQISDDAHEELRRCESEQLN